MYIRSKNGVLYGAALVRHSETGLQLKQKTTKLKKQKADRDFKTAEAVKIPHKSPLKRTAALLPNLKPHNG